MTVTIKDGWLSGTLPDDTGHEWPVTQSRQAGTGAQNGSPVNLVLHTTETDGLVGTLQYPSNFQTGEGRIVQHIQLGQSGDAVWTYDRDCIGIEMVGRSQLGKWLPKESTLGPTVALVAWLHDTGRIKSGLVRPYDYPVVLDKLPAAVATYYRRHDPRQKVGVYGHVDLDGGNSHWDPGSFDYPTFFARVSAVLQGGADEMAYADFKKGWKGFVQGDPKPAQEGDERFGWLAASFAASQPKAPPASTVPPHTHVVTGKAE